MAKRLRIWDSPFKDVEYLYEDANGKRRPIPFVPGDTERHIALKNRVLAKAKPGKYYPE